MDLPAGASAQVLQEEGSLDQGAENVRQAGELLETLLAGSEPYAGIRSNLDRIGRRMGEVEPAMYDDNRDAEIVKTMAPFRQRYWDLHARWAEAYGMLLQGKSDGLSARVQAIASESEKLMADVR